MLNEAYAWMRKGACKGADLSIFVAGDAFDDDVEESHEPSSEAMEYCLRCPVVAECLTHAVLFDLKGVWGGTSTYQRRQLRRPISRVACPVCGSQHMSTISDIELCINCGASWRRSI
jgi:WhiB family transcriptional regulator, redox-sensing transcriptional regulator